MEELRSRKAGETMEEFEKRQVPVDSAPDFKSVTSSNSKVDASTSAEDPPPGDSTVLSADATTEAYSTTVCVEMVDAAMHAAPIHKTQGTQAQQIGKDFSVQVNEIDLLRETARYPLEPNECRAACGSCGYVNTTFYGSSIKCEACLADNKVGDRFGRLPRVSSDEFAALMMVPPVPSRQDLARHPQSVFSGGHQRSVPQGDLSQHISAPVRFPSKASTWTVMHEIGCQNGSCTKRTHVRSFWQKPRSAQGILEGGEATKNHKEVWKRAVPRHIFTGLKALPTPKNSKYVVLLEQKCQANLD
mmetsp:Transcript_45773/g.110191  ORF Transcript_45773/g.110191 Transcript_45773/m.110191 type:complete len:302 (+) Transcript_45773:3-908(+)